MPSIDELNTAINACQKCPLHLTRVNAVPGEGPAHAEILFIGEAPGKNEDEQARPFVGRAGNLLDQLLASAGIDRRNIFITNVLKCRPPDNRDPTLEEITACQPWLEQQMEALNPTLVIPLGRHSTARFLAFKKIGDIRGQLRRSRDRWNILPIMHPAAGLRRGDMKQAIQADFLKIPGLLAMLRHKAEPSSQATRQEPTDAADKADPKTQTSLF